MRTEPLYNAEAEEAVIGGCILDPRAVHDVSLEAQEFCSVNPRRAWEAIVSLVFVRNEPVDALTVADEVKRQGHDHPDSVELADMASRVATAANVAGYALIVRRCATQRRLVKELSDLRQQVIDSEPEQIVELAEDIQRRVSAACVLRSSDHTAGEAVQDAYDTVMAGGAQTTCVATGFGQLDAIFNGLPRGYITVVGARPSHGKSVLCRAIADNIASRGIHVGYIALEEKRREFGMGLLVRRARVNTWSLSHDRLSSAERERLRACKDELRSLPIHLCDDRPLTVQQVCQRIRQQKARYGIEVAIVDYWNRLSLPGKRTMREEATGVVDWLSGVAGELGIALVVVAQLNRENERDERRPRLSDFKESGGWEEAAWVAMLLHRPGFTNADPAVSRAFEVNVAKSKLSRTATQTLYWEGEYLSVADSEPVAKPTPRVQYASAPAPRDWHDTDGEA